MSDLLLEHTDDTQSIDVFIGHKLRNIRIKSGATLLDIARRANVSVQLVQKYETGLTRIPVSILCRIADVLNTKPADFFEDYHQLTHKSEKKICLSGEKTQSLNVLLVSESIDIEYMLQKLTHEIALKMSLYHIKTSDDIEDYATQLKHIHGKIPVPDIILYDMPIEKTNCQDFIKKIRFNPLHIEAPIIVLSMSSDISVMQKAYCEGIAGYIYKNIAMSDLQENLKYLLLYWGRTCNLLGTIVH